MDIYFVAFKEKVSGLRCVDTGDTFNECALTSAVITN